MIPVAPQPMNEQSESSPPDSLFELLNRSCRCISTDPEALERETERVLRESHIRLPAWASTNVFAVAPVFVSPEHVRNMREVVSAATALTQSPSYHAMALERAPEIARHPVAHRSVFFGYDFHLGVNGPALIEINTNAGGAMLNSLLARAQKPCCEEVSQFVASADRVEALDASLVQMFQDEWELARGNQPLGTIAIVDDVPESQFLYPEFVLFRELFRQAGLEAFICGPEQLRFESSGLYLENRRVDLVYNPRGDRPTQARCSLLRVQRGGPIDGRSIVQRADNELPNARWRLRVCLYAGGPRLLQIPV